MIVPLSSLSSLDRFAFGPLAQRYLAIELTVGETAGTDWLRRLPCPVLGIGAADHPCAQACDIVVPSVLHLAPVVANIAAAPIAAMTLVQVLRASSGLHVADALVVESLAYATLQGGAENRAWLATRPPPGAVPQTEAPPVLAERTGATLTLTLNRPAALNTVNLAMRDALAEGLALAALDSSIARINLRGAGRCFSAGGALDEFGTAPDQATAHAVRSMTGPAFRLANVAGRSTAHVHGACIGAGAELASLCDHVVATEKTFFQLPEIKFGLIPGSGGTVGISRRIGWQRAAYLALSARRINVRQALQWGLVDAIAPKQASASI
jgi:enoyl-CoA hydratase/carnithine racemase